MGLSWEAPGPGRHRQRGRLRRWRARPRVVVVEGRYAYTGDTAPSRRIEPGDWGMHVDPRQVPTALMEPATDAGQPAGSIPVSELMGGIIPREMAGLHPAGTGLGWPPADD